MAAEPPADESLLLQPREESASSAVAEIVPEVIPPVSPCRSQCPPYNAEGRCRPRVLHYFQWSGHPRRAMLRASRWTPLPQTSAPPRPYRYGGTNEQPAASGREAMLITEAAARQGVGGIDARVSSASRDVAERGMTSFEGDVVRKARTVRMKATLEACLSNCRPG